VLLRDVWPRTAILQKVTEAAAKNNDLQTLADLITDPWDEGIL